MAIGALLFGRPGLLVLLTLLSFGLTTVCSLADDQIIKNDGTVINGIILGCSGGQVTVQSHTSSGGTATLPYYLTDIKSIAMATPADVLKVQAQGVTPGAVIATLEPEVKKIAGLPVGWVVGAMAQLGDAYAANGQNDQALAVYNEISQLYPGSAFENVAKTGKAKMSLKAGKIEDALAAVQPIVELANKDLAPSPSDGALYAGAFLVYGQALEAEKKPQQALEAYLTVVTMYYQNPNLAEQAGQLAKNLRDHNPGIGVE